MDQYLAAVGCPPGNPWCSAFVCFSGRQADTELGIPHDLKFSASALALWGLNPHLQFHALQPADIPAIAIHDHGGGHGHVFFVIGVDERTGALQTLEGNSDAAGSRTGGSVVALTRRRVDDAQLVGFLRVA